jgi:hypothetical protein
MESMRYVIRLVKEVTGAGQDIFGLITPQTDESSTVETARNLRINFECFTICNAFNLDF